MIDDVRRGFDSPPGSQVRQNIVSKIEQIEALNEIKSPLSSELINGCWNLRWTTSESILGSKRIEPLQPDPSKPILQYIDAIGLKARNVESISIGGIIKFENSVEAELQPISKSKCAVQFKRFNLGPLVSFNAPATARGELDTTFLDGTMRISRGDKGNLFVLTRE